MASPAAPGTYSAGAGDDEARKPYKIAARGGPGASGSTQFHEVVSSLSGASFLVTDTGGQGDIPVSSVVGIWNRHNEAWVLGYAPEDMSCPHIEESSPILRIAAAVALRELPCF